MSQVKQTKKSLFDALAFANVGNFSEFQTLLNARDETAPAARVQTPPAAVQHSAVVTPIRRISAL